MTDRKKLAALLERAAHSGAHAWDCAVADGKHCDCGWGAVRFDLFIEAANLREMRDDAPES